MSAQTYQFDVAIIGGGMAGTSLALLLSKSLPSLKIALFEALSLNKNRPSPLPSYDDRSSALSLGSAQIYEALGIWQKLKPYTECIKQVHVSDRGHPGGTVLNGEKLDSIGEELGYVIENRNFGAVLLDQIQNKTNILIKDNTLVEKVRVKENAVELKLSTQSELIGCKLLVIADGAESKLREQLGISASVTPYKQAAVIANVSTSSSHENIAYERFTDSGPMALLPLQDFKMEHRCALVWTINESDIENISQLDESGFLEKLQSRFGKRLGFFTKIGKRSVYPLALHKAAEQVRSRIVLMGNTAHSMHPVAGQGFNLSLRDCQSLTNILQQADKDKEDIGSLSVLKRYVQVQTSDQDNTIGASHLLTLLFSTNETPAAFARNTGLLGLNFLPGVKKWFAKQAMGLNGK